MRCSKSFITLPRVPLASNTLKTNAKISLISHRAILQYFIKDTYYNWVKRAVSHRRVRIDLHIYRIAEKSDTRPPPTFFEKSALATAEKNLLLIAEIESRRPDIIRSAE